MKKRKKKQNNILPAHFDEVNLNAAGIDISSQSHFVSVPKGCAEPSTREFKGFTSDLRNMVKWLKECNITTVAMESTGTYWIPVYEILEEAGFDVNLVDAYQVKNVSGRKNDVADCEWIQKLHTFGLLRSAFRPKEQICKLRSYMRQRDILIKNGAQHIQHMQKALDLMNLQLHHVVRDITGTTGLQIIRSIVEGERDIEKLASYRDYRCRNSEEMIKEALQGNYREEHLFSLKQALELYDIYREKITECDNQINLLLTNNFDSAVKATKEPLSDNNTTKKKNKNAPDFDVSSHLKRITGVDLMRIPGISTNTALTILSEIGNDMSHWKTAKQFSSWLGLCPNHRISGGKRLSNRTKRVANRASIALRQAASSLHNSKKTALGAFLRRLKIRVGSPKAITATAHKLAVLIYTMIKNGIEYVEAGGEYYERKYKERVIKNLQRQAKNFGFTLVENPIDSTS